MSDKFYTNVEQFGNYLYERGYDKEGKQFFNKTKFRPSLYTLTNKQTEYTNIFNQPVEKITFDSISDARNFIKRYEDVENFKYYGQEKWLNQYTVENYLGDIQYDYSKIRILYLDIETDSEDGYASPEVADKAITAITIVYNGLTVAMGMVDAHIDEPNKKYYKFIDEVSMLDSFLNIISEYKPDAVSGWNIEGYDIPYIVNRVKRVMGDEHIKRLSPWGIVSERKMPGFNGKDMITYEIAGVSNLDYLQVMRKFAMMTPDSWKLDHIAYEVLGVKKLDYSQYGNLRTLYKENPQLFIEYNIKDTELVKQLEDKKKLIELVFLIAFYSKVNPIDTFKNTRVWDSIIYNYLLKKNIIVCARSNYSHTGSSVIAGGHVKDPIEGMYDYITSYDATSLYPHIIMGWSISPENFVRKVDFDIDKFVEEGKLPEHIKLKENECIAGNGAIFKTDKKGFLPILMEELFTLRKSYKDKMLECEKLIETEKDKNEITKLKEKSQYYNNYQNILKILLNSLFGSLSNAGFRYFHTYYGEGITLSGQLILKWGEKYVNDFFSKYLGVNKGYVTYCDTDSLLVDFSDIIKKHDPEDPIEFLSKFGDKVMSPYFAKVYEKLRKETNCKQQKIHFKREKICDRGIFIAKKRYLLNVWDKEGTRYQTPKISITGVEAVRSSTPEYIRESLKKTFELIMNSDKKDVFDYIDILKDEFKKQDVETIAMPRSANNVSEYTVNNTYSKGTPIHVRGSILYNRFLIQHGLDKKYDLITDGEKIKFVYLKTPNPIHENVIAFPVTLPKEFGLHEYIDYNLQFEKTFMAPIQIIFDAIGWKINEGTTLEDFFE